MSGTEIISAARTPFGRFGGGIRKYTAVDLGTVAAREAIFRSKIDSDAVDYVVMGQVIQAGAEQIPSRQVQIAAGHDRSGRSNRDQRSVRVGGCSFTPVARRRSSPCQCERRRDRTWASNRSVRRALAGHACARTAPCRWALGSPPSAPAAVRAMPCYLESDYRQPHLIEGLSWLAAQDCSLE